MEKKDFHVFNGFGPGGYEIVITKSVLGAWYYRGHGFTRGPMPTPESAFMHGISAQDRNQRPYFNQS
jgi:hypothetical protein